MLLRLAPILKSVFSKKKRIRELGQMKIELSQTNIQNKTLQTSNHSYLQTRKMINDLHWENMAFQQLCKIPTQTLDLIQMQIKKDKFNISDSQFYKIGVSYYGLNYQNQFFPQLNQYYSKLYFLMTNNHEKYSILSKKKYKQKYLSEMFILDLIKDKQLQIMISYFINNLSRPDKLQAIAEATFVKKLLKIKRQLIFQGVKFPIQLKQNKKQPKKASKLRQQKIIENIQKQTDNDWLVEQQLLEQQTQKQTQDNDIQFTKKMQSMSKQVDKYQNKIQIVKILGYQYQFWVDVRHNRAKNYLAQDYIIQQKQIDNPNKTLLLKNSPKIKVKYIIHKRKRKQYTQHFVIKTQLLIKINNQHERCIKIQWNGPSDKNKTPSFTDYLIIDFDGIMNGNPTLRPIFQF